MERKTARQIALDTLAASRKDRAWADGYLKAAIRKNGLDHRDAALATRLGYGILQNQQLLDFYIGQYCVQPPERLEPIVLDVLRLGAYQILFMDRVPDSAAVSESVELVKNCGRARAAGMVNAVLRKIVSNKGRLPAIPAENDETYLATKYSHPIWLVRRCLALLGREETEAFLACNNEAVETTIQYNPLRGSEEALLESLQESGVSVSPHPWLPGCAAVSKTGDITRLPAFSEGRFLVQDAAAKLAALAAQAAGGMKVLDLCAAPGGKSFALAMAMGDEGEIRAFDLHTSKIRLIEEGARRLGITCIHAAPGNAKTFRPELAEWADLVLCDVPCSGLGNNSKKPDIRLKREKELSSLPAVQSAILDNAARYVCPGGVLLYATCTVLPEENEGVTGHFLDRHDAFVREGFTLPAPLGEIAEGQLTLWPQRHGTDGFYICRMRRKR